MKIDYYFWDALSKIIFWCAVAGLGFTAFGMALFRFGGVIIPFLGIPYLLWVTDAYAKENRRKDRERYDI